MFFHVVQQASEPAGFSYMNLALGVGSNIQVCSYSITAADNTGHQEADEMFATVGWLGLSWEPNS